MNKIFFSLALLTPIFSVNAAELSGHIGFTSDYRLNGQSQSAGHAAAQGNLNLQFESGIFLDMFGTSVDFGPGDDATTEIDYAIGYKGALSDELFYGGYLSYYTFPGRDTPFGGDFAEITAVLAYKHMTATYSYTDNNFDLDQKLSKVGVDLNYPLSDTLTLDLHASHNFGSGVEGLYGPGNDNYQDYAIGLTKSISELDFSVAYIINNLPNSAIEDFDDNTLVFAISHSF